MWASTIERLFLWLKIETPSGRTSRTLSSPSSVTWSSWQRCTPNRKSWRKRWHRRREKKQKELQGRWTEGMRARNFSKYSDVQESRCWGVWLNQFILVGFPVSCPYTRWQHADTTNKWSSEKPYCERIFWHLYSVINRRRDLKSHNIFQWCWRSLLFPSECRNNNVSTKSKVLVH